MVSGRPSPARRSGAVCTGGRTEFRRHLGVAADRHEVHAVESTGLADLGDHVRGQVDPGIVIGPQRRDQGTAAR